MATTVSAEIPTTWAQHTVEDTINVPLEKYWAYSLALNLEEIGSVGDYEELPKIVKTSPETGDFSAVGHSRRVHFDTEQTLLESILVWTYGFDQKNFILSSCSTATSNPPTSTGCRTPWPK